MFEVVTPVQLLTTYAVERSSPCSRAVLSSELDSLVLLVIGLVGD